MLAARNDEDLQACPLIGECLAEVAVGDIDYVDVELLLVRSSFSMVFNGFQWFSMDFPRFFLNN